MIFGERVRQARELRGLTQTELARRLNITQSSVAQVESGRLSPSGEAVEAIALQTGMPPSFFGQPPDDHFPLGSLLFRSKAAMTSREERQAHRYAQVGYRMIDKLLERVKPIPLLLPRIDEHIPAVAADITRTAFGLSPDQPISHLMNTIERSGVYGLALPIKLKNIDAFSSWAGANSGRPVVVLLKADLASDGARLRWSVAHEIGHLVMHRAMRGELAEIEREANQFAGQLLMPEVAIREELLPPVTLSSIAALKQRWGVSLAALIMRAFDLDMITRRQRTYLFQQLSAKGWRTREPPNLDVPVERPQSLPQLASLFYGTPIACARLASDVNLSTRLIEEFVGAHGGATKPGAPSGKVVSLEGFVSQT